MVVVMVVVAVIVVMIVVVVVVAVIVIMAVAAWTVRMSVRELFCGRCPHLDDLDVEH